MERCDGTFQSNQFVKTKLISDYYFFTGKTMNEDKFARLKAIAAGEKAAPSLPAIWRHEVDTPLLGTIKEFSQFEHNRYGTQDTVIVERESGELVSAILNGYLSTGMQIQQAEVGDLVLIQLQGKERSNNGSMFNKFTLIVDKK